MPPAAPYYDASASRQQSYRLAPPARAAAFASSEQRPERLSVPLGASCPEGFTVCPVARRAPQGGYLFACFDTLSSASHCGGCPSIGQAFWDAAGDKGVDCTAIPGVESATCAESRCRIRASAFGLPLSSSANRD